MVPSLPGLEVLQGYFVVAQIVILLCANKCTHVGTAFVSAFSLILSTIKIEILSDVESDFIHTTPNEIYMLNDL